MREAVEWARLCSMFLVFSASPEAIRGEPPEFCSLVQSANGGTWQSARR
jgi:hypothetical protein